MNSAVEIFSDNYLFFWYNIILSPINNFLFGKFNKYISNCEDYIFLILKNHEDIFDTRHVAKLSTLSIIPMLIPFIILIIAFTSVIAILRYGYRQLCVKKSLEHIHNRCWFYVQAIGTMVLVTLLFTGIVATSKISLLLDNSMRNDIITARGMLRDLHNEKAKFELHLIDVNKTLVNTLVSAEHVINGLAASVCNSIITSIHNEMDDVTKYYKEIMLKSDYIMNLTGVVDTSGNTVQNIEEQLTITEKLINVFITNLRLLENDIKNDTVIIKSNKNDLLEDIVKIQNAIKSMPGSYQFPNWIRINKYLNNTFNNVMPQINESLYFTSDYLELIQNRTKNEITRISSPLHNFQNKASRILKKLHTICQNIYPEKLKWFVNSIISMIDTKLSYVNGNGRIFGKFYASTLIVLIPVLHSKLYAILMTIICIHAVYQMKFVYTLDINGTTYSNCPVVTSKLITLFGLSLLWLGLVFAALCYMGALSLSIVCTPIMSDHLYTKYIDNTDVWANNNTWLDEIVYPWGHGYQLKEILEKCSTNVTIYHAFDIHKYWNISQDFENNKITINSAKLIGSIENAILSVQIPDGKLITFAKDNFSFVEKEIKQLSPHIMNDVERFQNDALKKYVDQLAEKLQVIGVKEYDEKLRENLNILEFIANQQLEKMVDAFMEFKYMVKIFQNDLNRIQNSQIQIKNKITANFKNLVKAEITNISDYINTLMHTTQKDLSNRIENEIGNCYFMPNVIEIVKQNACVRMPVILNMVWPLMLINACFMVSCMILSTCMCRHMTAVQREQQIWRDRIERDTQRETTKRLVAGTLLFDRAGKFLGESQHVVNSIEEEKVE